MSVAMWNPLTLPTPVAPKPVRWTIPQYRELGNTGLFHGKKTMLIRGEIFVMVFPNPPHDVALGLADDWLRTICPADHHVRNQMGFDIGTDNDPGPDLAVVPGSIRDYATRTPTAAAMIVEVAESSLFLDTTTKAELYATAGVPDYWVIDLPNRRLHIFREPAPLSATLSATAYQVHVTLSLDELASPLLAPSASVRVADLLP